MFSSMVGGWSPATGDSVVGRVENMPGGAVGDPPGSLLSFPHAITASRVSAATANIDDTLNKVQISILVSIRRVTPSRICVSLQTLCLDQKPRTI